MSRPRQPDLVVTPVRSDAADEEETRTGTQPAFFGTEEDSGGGIAPAQAIGRYMVLARAGAGAMGQVYAAYDPKLDRRVALKLLHAGASGAQGERLMREAKALARVSDPHVVTVHEVDEHDGRVLIAMEFVAGRTLKQWLAGHPPGPGETQLVDALGLLLQAGRGLEAAHRSGLVHRDFKPANVLIGEDGRVRVADFGLARLAGPADGPSHHKRPEERSLDTEPRGGAGGDSVTRSGVVMGTPAYMAPEQASGRTANAKSDQYSFCVTAWEALFGERPRKPGRGDARSVTAQRTAGVVVPAGLEAALRKGLSARAGGRHRDMAALLACLQSEFDRLRGRVAPSKTRGAVTMAGVALLVVGGVLGGGRLNDARLEAKCDTEAAAIDAVWNRTTRRALREGVLATQTSYSADVANNVMPWIDGHAEDWREHTKTACMNATVHGRWDAAQHGKARWCLQERRLRLSTLVTELANADPQTVQSAVNAAAGLPPVSPCVNEGVIANMAAPPASALHEEVGAIREQVARAAYLSDAGKYDQGLVVARAARKAAEDIDWLPLTAAARLREGNLAGEKGAGLEAEQTAQAAYMEAARSGTWGIAASAATKLAYTVGYKLKRPDEGRTWAAHAAAAIVHAGDPLGLRAADRLSSLGAISAAEGDWKSARAHLGAVLSARETVHGGGHPSVAEALHNLSGVLLADGAYDAALSVATRAVRIREQTLGLDHPNLAGSLKMLGEAQRFRGDYDDAEASLNRVVVILEKSFGPNHPRLASALESLGNVHAKTGQYSAALAVRERVLAIRTVALRLAAKVAPARLADSQFDLARALWDAPLHSGQDPTRARQLAQRAAAGYASAGEGSEGMHERTQTWLAEHLPRPQTGQ